MANGEISEDFRNMLRSMLWPFPKQRPSISLLLEKSVWLKQDFKESQEALHSFFSEEEAPDADSTCDI